MNKIIVTGATGFVGKVLIRKLVKKYGAKNLFCLAYNKNSLMETGGRKLLDKLNISYKLVDLTDIKTLDNLPKNPEMIIHLAAETDTSKKNHNVNNLGTKNLYNSLGKLGAKTHFIHIGTMVEVVGRPNCAKPINENSADYPTNEYTRTKLAGEKFIIRKCKTDKFKLTVIRPNTIYGKGFRNDSLFDMVGKMVRSGSLITLINWPGRSALIHIEDITDLIIKFLDKEPRSGIVEKYLAYSENLSIFEISQIIHNKLNKKMYAIPLPRVFWSVVKRFRKFIPLFENIFPYKIYNMMWRFGIIIDDVVWCESKKVFNKFKDFKPRKFKDVVSDVL